MFYLGFIIISVISFSSNAEYRLCTNGGSCPPDKPFCTAAGCVFECPRQFYVNGTNCVSKCDPWFVKDQLCMQHCPEDWFVRDILRYIDSHFYMEKQCTSLCSESEYIFANVCVGACPADHSFINDRMCVSKCPQNKEFLFNVSSNSVIYRKCVVECPQLVDGIYCTEECFHDKVVFNSTCVDSCPASHPLLSQNECVQTCPYSTVHIENGVCSRNCTKHKPFVLNETCVEICPDNFFITRRNEIVHCDAQCQPWELSYRHTCINSCNNVDDGLSLVHLNGTCLDECPSDYFLHVDYTSRLCVSKCEDDEFIDNKTCVKICPQNTVLVNSTCESKCPPEMPFHCLLHNGQHCDLIDPPLSSEFREVCVDHCPNSTFIHNTSCVNVCPVPLVALDRDCVSICPLSNPLMQNRTVYYRIWYKSFSYYNDEWFHLKKGEEVYECVPQCREGLVDFNGTCVNECPEKEKYRYLENGTCQDECTTRYLYNMSSSILCTDLCEEGDYVNNQTCVGECPENFYVTNKTCHIDECRTKYMYNASSVTICVDECTDIGFIRNKSCTSHCPFVVHANVCIEKCPGSHPFITTRKKEVQCFSDKGCISTIDYSECTKECPGGLYRSKYECVDICPIPLYTLNQTCVPKCPDSQPYTQDVRLGDGKMNMPSTSVGRDKIHEHQAITVCVNQCSSPNYLNKLNYSCVSVCPSEAKHIYQNNCIRSCPNDKIQNEIKTGIECIDDCPVGQLLFNSTCFNNCPQNTYNYNNSKCVNECPKLQPLGLKGDTWRCINSCENRKLFKNGTCIYGFNCEEPYFAFNGQCVDNCPQNYFWDDGCIKITEALTLVTSNFIMFGFFLFISKTVLIEYFLVLGMAFFKLDDYLLKDKAQSVRRDTCENDDEQNLLAEVHLELNDQEEIL